MFELLTFAPGEAVIEEGVVDFHLYILQSGTVAVRKAGTTVARIDEKGTFIGEISAILDLPRTCTVVAETECDILKLAQSIDDLIEKNPQITKRLLQELARRVTQMTDELIEAQHTLITFREERVAQSHLS